jgi:hypothetical protein
MLGLDSGSDLIEQPNISKSKGGVTAGHPSQRLRILLPDEEKSIQTPCHLVSCTTGTMRVGGNRKSDTMHKGQIIAPLNCYCE